MIIVPHLHGGKFAAGVIDTSDNLPPASLTLVANLPPVSPVSTTQANWWKNFLPMSLIPVVHLDLGISQPIFEKIGNGPNGIL